MLPLTSPHVYTPPMGYSKNGENFPEPGNFHLSGAKDDSVWQDQTCGQHVSSVGLHFPTDDELQGAAVE